MRKITQNRRILWGIDIIKARNQCDSLTGLKPLKKDEAFGLIFFNRSLGNMLPMILSE
ncbi:hypothetical protein IQ283_09775 [Alkalihalobacillus hwajinpoensis]|nr:hypothetical protein [Pseudalkalibacillus hwajinpoensis]